jgi:polar amino acid transport system substrate-binding protein
MRTKLGNLVVVRRLLVGLIALVGLSGCSTSGTGASGRFTPAHSGTLVVATAFFPSPGFWQGQPQAPSGGFEWSLALALAHRFGIAHVSVQTVTFGSLISGHMNGADLALSQLTPTAQRSKVLDFSSPYLDTPPGVVVRPGTRTPDLAALRTLQWVALRGSTLTRIVQAIVRPIHQVLLVASRPQALQAIQLGRAQAMLLDLPVGLALEQAMPGDFAVSAQLGGSEALAVALPHNSANLDAVNSAINAFESNGTIANLSKKWLGTDLSGGDQSLPLIRTQ